MATISKGGKARKVAEWRRVSDEEDGVRVERVYVLRSDGTLLRRMTVHFPEASSPSRGGYKVARRNTTAADTQAWLEPHGYVRHL